jgi:hypothetical protein
MPRPTKTLAAATALCLATSASAQTILNGKDLVVRSSGSQSGNAWSLNSTAYVGTYITVPAGGGTVSFTLNAAQGSTGSNNPHVNLVVADSKFGFDLTSSTATNYNASAFLPGGTYFVRTERDYTQPGQVSSRSAVVNSLSVTGATFSNTNTSTNALAAADSYIANFRKGNATVSLTGPGNIALLPGTQVNVDLKRHAFNFGTAIPGNSSGNVSSYLGNTGTAQQTNYQAKLNQNFNAIVPRKRRQVVQQRDHAGREHDGRHRHDAELRAVEQHARAHAQPDLGQPAASWATTLLSQAAAGNATAKADLRTEISERIGYYVGTARRPIAPTSTSISTSTTRAITPAHGGRELLERLHAGWNRRHVS